ncbi:SOS response-associated peptidase family protein [Cohnella sp. OV330]|nr:SOS response-associated peptidase family protein [Cohnella sp. OV330]
MIKRRRAIIPADGFYQWKVEEGEKQPYRLARNLYVLAYNLAIKGK